MSIYSTRRAFLSSAVALYAMAPIRRARALTSSGLTLDARDFGSNLNAAIRRLERAGGGTLRLNGSYIGAHLHIRGDNIAIVDGTLLNTRVVIGPSARRTELRNLKIIDRTRSAKSFLLDVKGRDCRFINVALEKAPHAGGYQGYIRGQSRNCYFDGLTLRGSNGLFMAGRGHRVRNFDFTSRYKATGHAGDDAFAVKGPGIATGDIIIEDGIVRGYAAMLSIGSEVGSSPEHPGPGSVTQLIFRNVAGEDCKRVCFIKPGALKYAWDRGLVENILMENVSLVDRSSRYFATGIHVMAGRGATVRGVQAKKVRITAGTRNRKQPTAAVFLLLRNIGQAAQIEGLDLEINHDGMGTDEFPIDHILWAEAEAPGHGTMRAVSLDLVGSDTRISGVHIGPGLDDAIYLRMARLERVSVAPPSSLGAGGIWSDSRLRVGDVQIDTRNGRSRGGRAFEQ